MILYGTDLTPENADSFTKTELMHLALIYKATAARLTAELAALERVNP